MIKTTVCMITYNHEKYIKQAVSSILDQKTKFKYELLIFDDASTDNTSKMLAKLQRTNPNIIKLKLRKKNVGMMQNFADILSSASGEYIAICEGDDYWSDMGKLQKQIDFLENNLEFSISSHNVKVVEESDGTSREWLGAFHRKNSTLKDLLRYGSNGATCSLVLRNNKDMIREYINLSKKISGGDWLIQIIATKYGNMRYDSKAMGVYRRHDGGATSAKTFQQKIDIYDKGGVKTCSILNKHFNFEFDEQIRQSLAEYFYPNLLKIYLEHGDIANARKYARKIMKEGLHLYPLSLKEWTKLFIILTPLYKVNRVNVFVQ